MGDRLSILPTIPTPRQKVEVGSLWVNLHDYRLQIGHVIEIAIVTSEPDWPGEGRNHYVVARVRHQHQARIELDDLFVQYILLDYK
jgi:hypothetical protein